MADYIEKQNAEVEESGGFQLKELWTIVVLNWQWIAKGISYIELGIGYRRTNSHHLAFHHFLGGTAHGGLCRSIYV